MKVHKDIQTLHLVICALTARTWENRTYRMSTLRVHGHRRDAGFGFDGQFAPLTLRTSESPTSGDRAPDRDVALAARLCPFPSTDPETVSAPNKGYSQNRSPYSHLDWIHPSQNSLGWRSVLFTDGVSWSDTSRAAGNSEEWRPTVSNLVLLQMSPTSYKTNTYLHPNVPSNLVPLLTLL